MRVVGLTGGISTGKSTVSRLLRDEYHVPIIDADVLAHRVYEPGTRAYKKIVAAFGEQVVSQDGSGRIDRKKVGEIVFENEEKRRVLNGIVHPEVRWEMLKEVFWCWWRGESWVVLDVPLLVESGIWRWVGEVVVVYCPAEVQLERLMKRDGSSEEGARARIGAQMGIEEKVKYANVVLDNSGSVEDLERRVADYVEKKQRR
ncbi:dephospho-CoA kinase [Amanita rubescens]|nr:dephospho-CoA kinase [Amanita rubescens]